MYIRNCPNCLCEISYKVKKNYEKSKESSKLCQKCAINKYNVDNEILTKDRCSKLASLCKTRKEFNNNYQSAYQKSLNKGWVDEVCNHMVKLGNRFNRCIYSYELPNMYVYVGLTYDVDERHISHKNSSKSTVNRFCKKNGIEIPRIKRITEYIDRGDASKREGIIKNKYLSDGWIIINKVKTGGLGGNTFMWDKDRCITYSEKCNTRTEFIQKYPGAYMSSRKNGWIEEVYKNLPLVIKEKNYWTKKNCEMESMNYKTRKDLKENCLSCYNTIIKNGWGDLFSHMVSPNGNFPKGYWTKNKCLEISRGFKNRTNFRKEYPGAYKSCKVNNWLGDLFGN